MAVGSEVFLRLEGDSLVVTPARPKYHLNDLLAQMKPEHRQNEVDWGPARGEESW
jgi:antitoxin MazE